MEPVLIDLNDYELSGGGFLGESYNHRTDPGLMLKLYSPDKEKMALDEYSLARKVYDAGIPTPEPGQLVRLADGRLGVQFTRIPDKKSYARAVGEDPSRAEEFAARFAALCRQLHSTRMAEGVFPVAASKYLWIVEGNKFLSTPQKDKVIRFISDVPDTGTAIHGDLHYGNVICAGGQDWLIDLGDFCTGNPLFDLGVAMLIMKMSPKPHFQELYHMDYETSIVFWEAFAKAYFGSDRPIASIEEELTPFAALRTLAFQNITDQELPMFQPLREALLGRNF